MKYPIILLLCAMGACTPFDQTLEYHVDPELEKHVNKFFLEAKKHGVHLEKADLIVEIVDECNNCSGQSRPDGYQRRVIIKRSTFDYYMHQSKDTSSAAIENIVFHELGHALLYRQHNDPDFSIMAYNLPVRAYEGKDSLRAVLVSELFNYSNK